MEFSNAYQEILLDNLVSIIKQNFIFQTQLKLAEESGKLKAEIETKYNELLKAHESLKDIKAKVDINASAHEEKTRLQGALNDIMKKNAQIKKDLEEKEMEILILKEYIEKLETIAPSSKLKKINPEKFIEEKPVEQPAPDLFAIKANDGSSF
jgi:predicted ribosome quality control (RQC) complex YloA/Tae2 family protein